MSFFSDMMSWSGPFSKQLKLAKLTLIIMSRWGLERCALLSDRSPLPSHLGNSGADFDVTEREVPGMFGADAAAIRPRRRVLSVHALHHTGFRDGVSAYSLTLAGEVI